MRPLTSPNKTINKDTKCCQVTKVQNVFKNVLWIKILTDYPFKNEREIQEIQRNITLFLRVHCLSHNSECIDKKKRSTVVLVHVRKKILLFGFPYMLNDNKLLGVSYGLKIFTLFLFLSFLQLQYGFTLLGSVCLLLFPFTYLNQQFTHLNHLYLDILNYRGRIKSQHIFKFGSLFKSKSKLGLNNFFFLHASPQQIKALVYMIFFS